MNGYSQSQIFPNPYTSGRYGPALSATQGFLNSYMQHIQIQRQMKRDLSYDQYRKSLMDISRSRLDISQQQLELARKREKRMALGRQETFDFSFGDPALKEVSTEAVAGIPSRGWWSSWGRQDFTKENILGAWREHADAFAGSAEGQIASPQAWETFRDEFYSSLEEAQGKTKGLMPWHWGAGEYDMPTIEELELPPQSQRMDLGAPKQLKLESGEPLSYDVETREPRMFGRKKSPYPEYPDAFQENGVWKVIKNGKKYRIEE